MYGECLLCPLYPLLVFIYLFIYFYTGLILIAVFITEMVILVKHVIIIIIIIIIIINININIIIILCPTKIIPQDRASVHTQFKWLWQRNFCNGERSCPGPIS